MNIKKYLQRINYSGSTDIDINFLKMLHCRHLFSVPFENLSIHYGENIELNTDFFFDKIIIKNRGGFCYELNGLFYSLLREIGFNADMISVRVKKKEEGYGREFDHLAIIVHLENDWLVDVGFGDSFIYPLKFKLNVQQKERDRIYKIISHDKDYFRLCRSDNGKTYEGQYIFSLKPRSLNEFEEMCVYHQTSPASSFTQKRVCTIATEDGRITLSDLKLIIKEPNKRNEILLKDEDEFEEKLNEYFGININYLKNIDIKKNSCSVNDITTN